jgi:hypothetical protein
MLAWVVIFSTDTRRAAQCRHVTKIPSPQLLFFLALTNCDVCNPFRICSYANCRVAYVRVLLSSIFRTFFQVPYSATHSFPFWNCQWRPRRSSSTNSHGGVGLCVRSVHSASSVTSALSPSLPFLSTFNCRLSTSSVPFFHESQITDYESQFPTSSILWVAL